MASKNKKLERELNFILKKKMELSRLIFSPSTMVCSMNLNHI